MRQTIAQHWKIIETHRDLSQTTKKLGKYTAYTAAEKMARLYPEHRFVLKMNHGFGGYWVDGDGNTAELLPDWSQK